MRVLLSGKCIVMLVIVTIACAVMLPACQPDKPSALSEQELMTTMSDCSYYHATWQDRVKLADKHSELPLNINIKAEWEGVGPESNGHNGDGCYYIDLWYDTTNDEKVPAYIVYPRNQGDGPFPIVVIGPGGGHGRDIAGLQHVAEYFANNGLAAMVITFKYYRERSQEGLYQACTDPQKRLQWMYQNFVDIRRALMVINKLGDSHNFDAAKAGYIGWSFGGLMGECATVVEPLFKAQVFCLAGSQYPEILTCGTRVCDEDKARKDCGNAESLEWVEPRWFLPHIGSDCPVLFIAGTKDNRVTPDEVEEAYDLVTSTAKELHWFEGGHSDFSIAEYFYAREWLKRKLQ